MIVHVPGWTVGGILNGTVKEAQRNFSELISVVYEFGFELFRMSNIYCSAGRAKISTRLITQQM